MRPSSFLSSGSGVDINTYSTILEDVLTWLQDAGSRLLPAPPSDGLAAVKHSFKAHEVRRRVLRHVMNGTWSRIEGRRLESWSTSTQKINISSVVRF